MKKLVMMAWMSMMLALGAGACVDGDGEGAPDQGAPVTSLDEGAPLTAEQRAALEENPQLREMRERLAQSGSTVVLDEARAFQRDDEQAIACPVRGPHGQSAQFSHLTVQPGAGGETALSLEPTEGYTSHHGVSADVFRDAALQPSGVQCEADWWRTRIIGRTCDWAWACGLGDATFAVWETERTCCAIGAGCWVEKSHTTVRERCGC